MPSLPRMLPHGSTIAVMDYSNNENGLVDVFDLDLTRRAVFALPHSECSSWPQTSR